MHFSYFEGHISFNTCLVSYFEKQSRSSSSGFMLAAGFMPADEVLHCFPFHSIPFFKHLEIALFM